MVRTAVLTGDVVRSTKLGHRTGALARRLEQAGQLAGELASGTGTAVDVFRGDAWQMAVRPPGEAIAVAIRFRIALRWLVDAPGSDTRISIGIGEVARLPRGRVSRGNGPAFRISGHGLDEMARGRRMVIRVDDPDLQATVDVIVGLIDTLVTAWSEPQAYCVDCTLLGWTQGEIAQSWEPKPISQQAVNKHLQRAGWPSIERALRRCEELLG